MSDKAVYTEHIYQEYSYKHVSPIEQREEIVRCRDCKHATPDTSGRKCYEGYLWCDELTEGIGFSVAPSDFCAWGERRDA